MTESQLAEAWAPRPKVRLLHERDLGGFSVGVDSSLCVVIVRRPLHGEPTVLTVTDVEAVREALAAAQTLVAVEEERRAAEADR